MKYEAVIVDLDGTLLNDSEQICPTNHEAIQLALKNGFKITLASGRPHELILPYAESLQLDEPIICCNGAYLYDPKSKTISCKTLLAPDFISRLLTSENNALFDFTLYTSNGIFAQKDSTHLAGLKTKAAQAGVCLKTKIIGSHETLLKQAGDIYKVLVSSNDKSALCQLRDSIQSECQADLSTPTKLDITSLGATKGKTANHWLSSLNIPHHSAIAFGDGDNDASLFELVGEPVAMANASPSLKGMANLIVTDNNGCGIGQYLRLIVQEGQHTCQHSFSY